MQYSAFCQVGQLKVFMHETVQTSLNLNSKLTTSASIINYAADFQESCWRAGGVELKDFSWLELAWRRGGDE